MPKRDDGSYVLSPGVYLSPKGYIYMNRKIIGITVEQYNPRVIRIMNRKLWHNHQDYLTNVQHFLYKQRVLNVINERQSNGRV